MQLNCASDLTPRHIYADDDVNSDDSNDVNRDDVNGDDGDGDDEGGWIRCQRR